MLHNVKKSFILTKIQMLFSENPDVYVKKQVQIRTQRPQITLKHMCLFLSFFQSKNLLHSVIGYLTYLSIHPCLFPVAVGKRQKF